MGTCNTYRCNNCDYNVLTSAGKDSGMVAVTDTYICLACHKIVDIVVGECGKVYNNDEIPVKSRNTLIKLEFYRCPECDGKNLVKWNTRKRPCPRCQGKMNIDEYGEFMHWD